MKTRLSGQPSILRAGRLDAPGREGGKKGGREGGRGRAEGGGRGLYYVNKEEEKKWKEDPHKNIYYDGGPVASEIRVPSSNPDFSLVLPPSGQKLTK